MVYYTIPLVDDGDGGWMMVGGILYTIGIGGGGEPPGSRSPPSFFLSLSFESIGFFDQPISCGAVRGNYSSRFMFCHSKKSQVQHCLMVLSISPPPRAKPCDTCVQGLSYRYWLKLHMRDKHETATAVRNNP